MKKNIDFFSDINKDLGKAMNYSNVDAFMVKVLWWQFGVFVLLVFLNAFIKIAKYHPSPLSWRVISPTEAIWVLLIAMVFSLSAQIFLGKVKNHYLWRIFITVAMTVYSYLFVFTSGGAIEMHFHFFIMITLVVLYNDWRLSWFILVMTALHHVILNLFEPEWVYVYGRNDVSVIAHAVPVLVLVIFTTVLCNRNRSEILFLQNSKTELEDKVVQRTQELKVANVGLEQGVKERTAELEKLKDSLESTIEQRTTEVREKLAEVERLNQVMINRELKMVQLKKEIANLKGSSLKEDEI